MRKSSERLCLESNFIRNGYLTGQVCRGRACLWSGILFCPCLSTTYAIQSSSGTIFLLCMQFRWYTSPGGTENDTCKDSKSFLQEFTSVRPGTNSRPSCGMKNLAIHLFFVVKPEQKGENEEKRIYSILLSSFRVSGPMWPFSLCCRRILRKPS